MDTAEKWITFEEILLEYHTRNVWILRITIVIIRKIEWWN